MDRKMLVGLLKDWGIALVITVAALVVWRLMAPSPATEGPAPELTAPFVDGRPFDLADREADAYVVNFWATWCAPCREEIPEFTRFSKAHPNVEVYGVSVDADLAPMQLEATARRLGIRYDVLHDANQAAASEWGVKSFPTTFVINSDHEIVAVRVGKVNEALLDELIHNAL